LALARISPPFALAASQCASAISTFSWSSSFFACHFFTFSRAFSTNWLPFSTISFPFSIPFSKAFFTFFAPSPGFQSPSPHSSPSSCSMRLALARSTWASCKMAVASASCLLKSSQVALALARISPPFALAASQCASAISTFSWSSSFFACHFFTFSCAFSANVFNPSTTAGTFSLINSFAFFTFSHSSPSSCSMSKARPALSSNANLPWMFLARLVSRVFSETEHESAHPGVWQFDGLRHSFAYAAEASTRQRTTKGDVFAPDIIEVEVLAIRISSAC